MRNFLLGVLLTLSLSTLAAQFNEDGSVVLSKGDADLLNTQWYQLNKNFELCVSNVGDLRHELEILKKGKCT
jgi:hypothetical protein